MKNGTNVRDEDEFSQFSDDFVQNDDNTAESASDDFDGKVEELYAKHQEAQQHKEPRMSRPETASRSRPPSAGTSLSGDMSGDFLAQAAAAQGEQERETYQRDQQKSSLELARQPSPNSAGHRNSNDEDSDRDTTPAYGVNIDDTDEDEAAPPPARTTSGRPPPRAAAGTRSEFVQPTQGTGASKGKAERVSCPTCGTSQKATRKFCPECGSRMPRPPPAKKAGGGRRGGDQSAKDAELQQALALQTQLAQQLGNSDSSTGKAALPPSQHSGTPRRSARGSGAHSARERPHSSQPMRPWSAQSGVSTARSRPMSARTDSSFDGADTLRASQRLDQLKKKERKEKRESRKIMKAEQRRVEWNALHMLEEVNKWSQALGEEKMYRAFKGTEHGAELKVHIYQNGMKIREIPLDMFIKRHAMLKAKVAEMGRKRLELDRSQKPSTDENRQQSKSEIRSVLLETVQLISQLQTQLSILKRKGGKFSPYVQ